MQDCAISLLKSDNLDWVDCALFVLRGVQRADVKEAREALARNEALFERWLIDQDAHSAVFDIIEELCIEGYFKELPAVYEVDGATPDESRFLGMLLQVKAAIGLLAVDGAIERYLFSSDEQILKGAINACRYFDKMNARITYRLRSIAFDGNHPLWRDAAEVLRGHKWKRESERDRASRGIKGGIPRWLYPLLPVIVKWAQEGQMPVFQIAFEALRSSVGAREVRRAVLVGVVSHFEQCPMLIASPLSRLVSEEVPVDELVEYALLG